MAYYSNEGTPIHSGAAGVGDDQGQLMSFRDGSLGSETPLMAFRDGSLGEDEGQLMSFHDGSLGARMVNNVPPPDWTTDRRGRRYCPFVPGMCLASQNDKDSIETWFQYNSFPVMDNKPCPTSARIKPGDINMYHPQMLRRRKVCTGKPRKVSAETRARFLNVGRSGWYPETAARLGLKSQMAGASSSCGGGCGSLGGEDAILDMRDPEVILQVKSLMALIGGPTVNDGVPPGTLTSPVWDTASKNYAATWSIAVSASAQIDTSTWFDAPNLNPNATGIIGMMPLLGSTLTEEQAEEQFPEIVAFVAATQGNPSAGSVVPPVLNGEEEGGLKTAHMALIGVGVVAVAFLLMRKKK